MKYFLVVLGIAVSIFAACGNNSTGDLASRTTVSEKGVKEVSVQDANDALKKGDVQFIDVRTIAEYKSGHAANALNLPLDTLEKEMAKLDANKPVYLICQTGIRSAKGARILSENRFGQVFNVTGGTSAWIAAGLPTEMNSSE